MILTTDEIEKAARRLLESSQPWQRWETLDDDKKQAYRMIVTDLAAKIDMPHSAGAVAAFMLWMGDEDKD